MLKTRRLFFSPTPPPPRRLSCQYFLFKFAVLKIWRFFSQNSSNFSRIYIFFKKFPKIIQFFCQSSQPRQKKKKKNLASCFCFYGDFEKGIFCCKISFLKKKKAKNIFNEEIAKIVKVCLQNERVLKNF